MIYCRVVDVRLSPWDIAAKREFVFNEEQV